MFAFTLSLLSLFFSLKHTNCTDFFKMLIHCALQAVRKHHNSLTYKNVLPAKTIFLVSGFASLAKPICVILAHFHGKSLYLHT